MWFCSFMTSSMLRLRRLPITLLKSHPRNYVSHRYMSLSAVSSKPAASEVLTCHLEGSGLPAWTSYFVKYRHVEDDQWGKSHFNWRVKHEHNYHILRTGCYPYIKYHCTRRPHEDLTLDDFFFRTIKVVNLGIPCLAYGLAFQMYWRKHTEIVQTSSGPVPIYFHYQETKDSLY